MAKRPSSAAPTVPLDPLELRLARTMSELEQLGSEGIRRIYRNHGAPGSLFGAKISDMKVLLKRIRGDQALALALFDTGNYDAQYLAGLLADGRRMSVEELQGWAERAPWHAVAQCPVAWNAAESPHALELGLRWIDDPRWLVTCAGWTTLSILVAMLPDESLDLALVRGLLERIPAELEKAPNDLRSTLVGFVIAVGGSVVPLYEEACAMARRIGRVEIDMGNTGCKLRVASEYIDNIVKAGRLGHKRKHIKC